MLLLVLAIIVTFFIDEINANKIIVVVAPDVRQELVQSLRERFYNSRDRYEYVDYGESSTPKDCVFSIQSAIETYTSSNNYSWLHLIVFAPSNNDEKMDDTNSIVRFRNVLQ